jgi:hypothetical protein
MMEGSRSGAGSVLVTKRIRKTQKHTDPTDAKPDPQHWHLCISGVIKEDIINNLIILNFKNSNTFFTIVYYGTSYLVMKTVL